MCPTRASVLLKSFSFLKLIYRLQDKYERFLLRIFSYIKKDETRPFLLFFLLFTAFGVTFQAIQV